MKEVYCGRFLLVALLSFLARPADAVTLEMNGVFTQGGIIMGRTDPGELALMAARIGADGVFTVGAMRNQMQC